MQSWLNQCILFHSPGVQYEVTFLLLFKADDLEPFTCLPRVITSDSKGSDCLHKWNWKICSYFFFLTAVIVSKTPDTTGPLSLGNPYPLLYDLQWQGTNVHQTAQGNPNSVKDVLIIWAQQYFSCGNREKNLSKIYIQLWWLSAMVGLGPKC